MTPRGRDALDVTRSDAGLVTVLINRPDRLNALDFPTVSALIEVLGTETADPGCRALMITGAGSAFSTGADLQAMAEPEGRATPEQTMSAAAALVDVIVRAPVPVIAAVNGPAAGVGVSMALAADLCVMSEDAYLFFAFTGIGLMPDGGASELIAASVGRARAMRMLLGAEKVPGGEAADLGLVARCLPADGFPEAATGFAERFARGPRRAYELTKRAVNNRSVPGLDAALAEESDGQSGLLAGAEFAEGAAAMLEKRAPRFP